MTPQQANALTKELRRQILLFGTTCRWGCATSYGYIHKGHTYCSPHYIAIKHVND